MDESAPLPHTQTSVAELRATASQSVSIIQHAVAMGGWGDKEPTQRLGDEGGELRGYTQSEQGKINQQEFK